jgi:hypothetical protein
MVAQKQQAVRRAIIANFVVFLARLSHESIILDAVASPVVEFLGSRPHEQPEGPTPLLN